MTQFSNGIYEDSSGNLVNVNGKILVPTEKRTKTEVYSRVVGYMRPVGQWNKGQKAMWNDRTPYIAPKIESPEVGEESDA
jgi:hypothetical protein